MTKPAGTPRKKPEPRRGKPDVNPSGRLTPLILSPPTLRHDAGTVSFSGSWPTPPDSSTRLAHGGPDPARNFFLGSTSYAAVFTEEQPLPDTVHEQPSERMGETPSTSTRNMGYRHCQFALGSLIVSTLSPFDFFERSCKMSFETQKATAHEKATALVAPLILSALPQLRKDLELLNAASNDTYALYADMTRNTARPLKVSSDMRPCDFHTLFTGKNLRWEALGLVLVIAGSKAQYTAPNDSLFTLEDGTQLNKNELVEDIMHAANTCINICQTHGAVNESAYSLCKPQHRSP